MRPIIEELYCDNGKTLSETEKILEETHGFKPSTKAYKDKIKSWGLFKNKRSESDSSGTQRMQERSSDQQPDYLKSHTTCSIDPEAKTMPDRKKSDEIREPDEASDKFPNELPKILQLKWKGQDIASLNQMIDRGKMFQAEAKYEEAEQLFRDAYGGYAYLLGPKESMLDTARYISHVCRQQGKHKEAAEILVQTTHQMIEKYGLDSRRNAKYLKEYTEILIAHCRHVAETYGQNDRQTLKCMEEYAKLLLAQSYFLNGEIILERVLDGYGYDGPVGSLTEEKVQMWMQPVLLIADACLKRHEYRNLDRAEQLLTRMKSELEALELPQNEEVENKLAELVQSQGLGERAEKALIDPLESIGNLKMKLARDIYIYLSEYYRRSNDEDKVSLLNRKHEPLINALAQDWDQSSRLLN